MTRKIFPNKPELDVNYEQTIPVFNKINSANIMSEEEKVNFFTSILSLLNNVPPANILPSFIGDISEEALFTIFKNISSNSISYCFSWEHIKKIIKYLYNHNEEEIAMKFYAYKINKWIVFHFNISIRKEDFNEFFKDDLLIFILKYIPEFIGYINYEYDNKKINTIKIIKELCLAGYNNSCLLRAMLNEHVRNNFKILQLDNNCVLAIYRVLCDMILTNSDKFLSEDEILDLLDNSEIKKRYGNYNLRNIKFAKFSDEFKMKFIKKYWDQFILTNGSLNSLKNSKEQIIYIDECLNHGNAIEIIARTFGRDDVHLSKKVQVYFIDIAAKRNKWTGLNLINSVVDSLKNVYPSTMKYIYDNYIPNNKAGQIEFMKIISILFKTSSSDIINDRYYRGTYKNIRIVLNPHSKSEINAYDKMHTLSELNGLEG